MNVAEKNPLNCDYIFVVTSDFNTCAGLAAHER